jgi:Golgi nucleoside diphosphatase
MKFKYLLASVVVAASIGMAMAGAACAGAGDYAFEPVNVDVKKGDDAVVAVRLFHKPTGKRVSDAVLVSTRIDMGPDGMPTMASPLELLPKQEPGIYAFKTELAMAGRWLLSIAAKVQGEPETVTGKIIFKATK